ncbi:MAG: ABC transporter substrate-binding protein [Thermodesulfobacteriota bacterium]|nr:ABC transporter substrate-binding protein [Thermodesulfobacteriota bacterium]
MKNRKILFIFFALSLAAFFTFSRTAITGPEKKEPLRIGVNLEFTGPLGDLLNAVKYGLEVEKDRVNAGGGINGRPIELVYRDNAMDGAKAVGFITEFAQDKSILAMIGPLYSTFTAIMTPAAEKNKLPQIVLCPSSPEDRKNRYKWSFNIAQADTIVAERLLDLIRFRGYKRILALHDQDPCYIAIAQNLKEYAKKYGITVHIPDVTFRTTDVDITPQWIKLKPILEKEKIDCIFLDTNGATGSIALKNMQTLGINYPVIAPHGFGFGFTLVLGKGVTEGVELVSGKVCVWKDLDDKDPQKPVMAAFDAVLKEKYKFQAEQLSGHSYDAIQILAQALKRCGKTVTRDRLREEIEKTKNFIGITGIYNYSPKDHDGLTKKALALIRIQDNQFRRIMVPREYD